MDQVNTHLAGVGKCIFTIRKGSQREGMEEDRTVCDVMARVEDTNMKLNMTNYLYVCVCVHLISIYVKPFNDGSLSKEHRNQLKELSRFNAGNI